MTTKSDTDSGIEIFFDGYCPESRLQGKQVEMRLNDDDFWESEATGLQMTVFPPYAAILRWRGQGRFRQTKEVASDTCTGLVMAMAGTEEGAEIFPDETELVHDKSELRYYLGLIYKTREEFEEDYRLDLKGPRFETQRAHLASLPATTIQHLVALFEKTASGGTPDQDFTDREGFLALHQALYDNGIIFVFNWSSWQAGKDRLQNPNYDLRTATLTELSMFLTALVRANRFSEGTLDHFFENGVLQKIFSALLPAWERETGQAATSEMERG